MPGWRIRFLVPWWRTRFLVHLGTRNKFTCCTSIIAYLCLSLPACACLCIVFVCLFLPVYAFVCLSLPSATLSSPGALPSLHTSRRTHLTHTWKMASSWKDILYCESSKNVLCFCMLEYLSSEEGLKRYHESSKGILFSVQKNTLSSGEGSGGG